MSRQPRIDLGNELYHVINRANGRFAIFNKPQDYPQKGSAMSALVDESTYTDPVSSGSAFKWDAGSQQYIYNWSTKGLVTGYWYRISAKLDDGTVQSVLVGLR